MEIKQIYDLVNTATRETVGESVLVAEDLSNLVDVGREIYNLEMPFKWLENLIPQIGKMVFVNRPYAGRAPSVLMDGFEYGAVLAKICSKMPEAQENESWELEDGVSYDPNIFTAPSARAKFFSKYVTFEIARSVPDNQLKLAFTNATQMNAFLSMLMTLVENSMTVKIDNLIMRTISNMIINTVIDEYGEAGDNLGDTSGVRAVNLLSMYNEEHPNATLTAGECISNPDFIRFASYKMGLYSDFLRTMSTLFNVGRQERFTPDDRQHFVLLSQFAKSANVYLQSDTFHNEFTALPNAETVPYWQGSGEGFDFSDCSTIKAKAEKANGQPSAEMEVSGILGVIFDRDALGVSNVERKVTTQYNGRAEFTNYWYKYKAGYFNDLNENFVVFFVA